jgi:hypothetical protein
MQLRKLSLITSSLLISLQAEDSLSINYLHYSESDDRVQVNAPSITFKKDFGTDYSLRVNGTFDSISGASPNWVDSQSGASKRSFSKNSDNSRYSYENMEFEDTRTALSGDLTIRQENRDEFNVGISISRETDYYGNELSLSYISYIDSLKNSAVSIGGSVNMNEILSYNHHTATDSDTGASKKEESSGYTFDIGFSQNIDSSSIVKLSLFGVSESGYLSNNYRYIVRKANGIESLSPDSRPDDRFGTGGTVEYRKSLEPLTLYGKYRYYSDDWGIDSHTVDGGLYYNFDDEVIINPSLRYYNQSEADFYSSGNFNGEKYGSSDERLSDFSAMTYKLQATYNYNYDWSYNIGINYYDQTTGLSAFYTTVGVKYLY